MPSILTASLLGVGNHYAHEQSFFLPHTLFSVPPSICQKAPYWADLKRICTLCNAFYNTVFAPTTMLPQYHYLPYTLLQENLVPRRRAFVVRCKILALGFSITIFLILGTLLYKPTLGPVRKVVVPNIRPDFQVKALVFYGRRSRVSILNCYLRHNLVTNGGLLDEVIFVARTNDEEDLKFLDHLVSTTSRYTRLNLTHSSGDSSRVPYGAVWDYAERGVIYIKIDDDVVFIDNFTISRLVASKAAHPENLLTSANSINNPALSWVHYHLGVIRPYLPELNPSQQLPEKTSWRASELPIWTGHPSFSLQKTLSPPSKTHRWLPLGPECNLDGTPITTATYLQSGPGLKSWAVLAQQHYSFLEALEEGEVGVSKYYFDMWDYQYYRVSINLIAIWGDDIVDNRPFPDDDEEFLTVTLSKRLGRHAVIDGKAVAAHYAFSWQVRDGGIEKTDVLERYRAYAEEKMCHR